MDKIKKVSMSNENVAVSKPRNSNLELFRIIVMFLIVLHHSIVNSGLVPLIEADFPSTKSTILAFFGCAGKIGINCFVLITGYFMCTSKITLRKGLKLLLEIEFYKIAIFAIFVATGYIHLSFKSIFNGIMPVTSISDGFVSCYLVFYCFIPFLNILIQGMNKRLHLILICLCLLAYSLPAQVFMTVSFNYVGWFMVVYFIAAYFRLYPPQWSMSAKYTGLFALLFWTISLCCVWGWAQYCVYRGKPPSFFFFVADSNKPLAIATAVSFFLFFKNLKLGYSRVINTIAASAFGVLLIHANSEAMRQWLWLETLDNVGHYSIDIFAHVIVGVLLIYAVCTLIDLVRIHLLEKPVFKVIDSYLEKKH